MKPTLIFDLEVYRDYFLAGFLNHETGNVRQFEMWPAGEGDAEHGFEESQPLDRDTIHQIIERYRLVSFNGNNYDIPVLSAALRGATCAQLKEISDKIIRNNLKPWNLGIEPVRCDHIDIFEVAPGMASLKIYGGRLHCPKMQDLPIDEAASITPEQRPLLREYNANDLGTTKALFDHLRPQIELREKMSVVYGIDLRSKSDAQIAEAVIVKEVGKVRGENIQRPEVPSGTTFQYRAPKFLRFESQELQDLLAAIQRVEFLVPDGGNVLLPPELAKRAIRIAGGDYRMGIGGLHSSEKTISHFSDDAYGTSDVDVVSYYPRIILNNNLAPAHMGDAFSRSFRNIVEQRVAAKKAGNKVSADSLKIVANGSFGKLGSKWSKLYSPHLMIQTTVTGQLALLMLIESLEANDFRVLSANTDGLTIRYLRSRREVIFSLIRGWEEVTGFETEETAYRAVHSRDVNNYLAIKTDGAFKLKGAFAMEELCASKDGGIATNPANKVCVEAMAYFLRDGKPIRETIEGCDDIRKFVTIRQVNGGAIDQQGQYLGKAVRWYYAKGVEGPLRYKINNYTVARSEGARACMQLPEEVPEDLDREWYVRETLSILADVGIDPVAFAVRELV